MMNKIVKNILLVRDKFMPEMHLRQSGFTCNAIGLDHLTKKKKDKERMQKFKETGDSIYLYTNKKYI